ncbi:hypothetical protein [Nocardioides marmotae]|uniref:hypothetical protein n=1 Tax=Nocardioides marmotae TaxID=2663857 RepID=UPI0012B66478|nr:hypothetical protein [Nocardioides marmotae]MBC9732326.1 hypothetical protein [Nocardioides marmotae]MTB83446.1 hypothetical protein [Nocardioides marmotae]
MAAPRRRWTPTLLVVVVALMINLPVVHGFYLDQRLSASGVEQVARVEAHREAGGGHFLQYAVDGTSYTANVEQDVYEDAVRTGEIGVRVLPGDSGVHRVDGEVTSRLGLVITLAADAALALMLYLLWRFRGRLRPQLRLVATQDVERCPPGSVLDRIAGDRYVVCGEVLEIGDGELVLDLGDRRVQVLLDGHANPVGHQQPAKATGRMVG